MGGRNKTAGTMRLKTAILSVLSRDSLKRIVDRNEISHVDRRSVEIMRTALSRSRRVKTEDLLSRLRKDELKAVCEKVGVSIEGRREELIKRLGSVRDDPLHQARTSGLEDGTRIRRRGKGWVVIDRHGFFLADPHTAAWVGRADDRTMPPTKFPTPEAAYEAWKRARQAALALVIEHESEEDQP